MKKLRLISFMLAFVMVVAMMVPALSILVAAEGETLPAGDTIAAWNIGWPGGSVTTAADKATTGEVDNLNKAAAWAGQTFQTAKLKTITTDFVFPKSDADRTKAFEFKNLDAANLYGLMFELNSGSNANTAFVVSVEVDGVAYYNLGKIGDETAESPVYTGPQSYIQTANGWVAVNNMDYAFSGAAVNTTQRAIRVPNGLSAAKVFVPLESFTAFYAGDTSAYNTAMVTNAEVLTADTLAAATSIKIYVAGMWEAPAAYLGEAYAVYSMDYVPEIAMPTVLPGADTTEWIDHPGYGAAPLVDFPMAFSLNTALVGKAMTASNSVLAASIQTSADGGDQFANADVEAVAAAANVAGILVKVKTTEFGSNNNGFMFGFTANGNRYAFASNIKELEGKYLTQAPAYMYDSENDTWSYYRDKNSHCTARLPDNSELYVFLPLDGFRTNTAAAGARPVVSNAANNLVADLTTAGISNVEIGKSWGAGVTLSEVCYVYVDGYNALEPTALPGAAVTGWNLSFCGNPLAIKTDRESLGNIEGFDYAAAWGGAEYVPMTATKQEAVLQSKFLSSYKYDLGEADLAELVGFKVAYSNAATSGNNAVVFQLKVDDVVYYSVSYNERALVYFQYDGSDKWFAASNNHLPFSGQVEGNYERATRLPAQLAGELFVPVESFYSVWTGGLDGYNGTKAEAETQLTTAALAAATSVELYVSTTWGDGVLGDGEVVTKGAYINYAPEGDKPATLPSKDDVAFRTDYNNNFWTENVVAENVVTPMDSVFGAEFTTTAPDAIGENAWADLGGFLLTVSSTEQTTANINVTFSSKETNEDGSAKYSITLSTNNGYGAKPVYLWQGGNKWIVEGTTNGFTIPANYTGYIFVPASTLTTDNNRNDQFVKGAHGFASVTYLAVVDRLADYTMSAFECTATVSAVEMVWIDGLGETYDASAQKPTTFPVLGETNITGYGAIYTWAEGEEAFTTSFTPYVEWNNADDYQIPTGNGQAIKPSRNLSAKFDGVGMLTETLVSTGATMENNALTFTVDGEVAINPATAAGLLFKLNMIAGPDGLGLDFGVKVGEDVYRFFNNAANNSYDTENGLIYVYDNFYGADASWTATYGDSKIRLMGTDAYVLVPFALLRCGSKALDTTVLAEQGISEIYINNYWNSYVLNVESVELASAAATIGGASVTMGDDLSMKVSAIVSGTPTSVAMNFIIGENTVKVDGVAGENGAYTFTLANIGAHQMLDEIDLELVVDDAVICKYEDYSIVKYATNLLAKTQDDKLKTLLVDLLYYGEAMQVLLNYNTDKLPTEALTADQMELRSLNTISRDRSKTSLSKDVSANAQWKGYSIALDGGIKLVFKAVVLDTNGIVANVKDGETTTAIAPEKWGVESNEYTIVYNVGITTLANSLTANFAKGAETDGATYTLTANAAIVALYKNAESTDAEKEAALSLYLLGTSVAAYLK